MPDDFNPLFDLFVKHKSSGRERLQGYVAYALYKQAKREWAEKKGRKPTDDELKAYVETWTDSPSRLSGLTDQSSRILDEFGDNFVQAARSGIREDALRGTFRKAVWSSVVGTFSYSALLLAILILLKTFGVDVLGLAEKLGPPDPVPINQGHRGNQTTP